MALLYLEEDGSFQRQSVYATIAAENIWDIVPIAGDKFWVLGDISINDGIATLLLEIDNQGEVLRQITLKDDQFTYYTQLTLHPDGGLFLSGRNGASGVNKSILTLSRCFKSLVQKSSSSESNRSILNKGRFNQPRRSGGGSGQ